MDRPLISYLVVSNNQESYIREAVASALAQDYSPLEIVISDDCSRDRTFEIVEQAVAAYRGPHRVRLNRNQTNVGIGGNINRAMELCSGELVVGAAGDDVALPERTEVIYQAWEQTGRQATSIFSSYITISAEGEELEVGGTRGDPADATLYRPQPGGLYEYLSKRWPVVVGCTHAWSRELFRYFGPLSGDLEDLVLSFRTLAIGQMLYVHRPLIKYRRHGENVSFFASWDDTQSFEHREKRLRWTDKKTTGAYANMIQDMDTLCQKGRLAPAECERLKTEARRVVAHYALESEMMDENFLQRWLSLAERVRQGHIRCAIRSLPRGLPRRMYRALYLVRDKWRSSIRTRRMQSL